jgi:cysteine synthase A
MALAKRLARLHPAMMMAGLWQPIVSTPVSELMVTYRGASHRVLLKHESHSPTGSVKDRTAIGLLRCLDAAKPLVPGTVVVESTSGNLGIALAHHLARLDCHLIAVIDPKTPAATQQILQSSGASLCMVDEPDGLGGYLISRLRTVQELCLRHPDYRWTNQYESFANPGIHEQTTAPEILRQGGPALDAIYVAVSTGGTLAGIARHVRQCGRFVRLVAVDAYSSLASAPPARDHLRPAESFPTARVLPGIGASRRSSFLRADSFDRRFAVRDAEAIAMCRILREDTAMGIGGSTGCVLSACIEELGSPLAPVRPLCLSPDDASKYEDTVYDDSWLDRANLSDEVFTIMARARAEGLSFTLASTPCCASLGAPLPPLQQTIPTPP